MTSPKVVAVSGGFDPIHIGHVRMFKEARDLGDSLVVIMNNDNWLHHKKGFVFMPEAERVELIEHLPFVDKVVLTKHQPGDTDRSVCATLEEVHPDIFANGGDRFADNIPEFQLCTRLNIEMIFNIGQGGKVQSSSDMVRDSHKALNTVHRPWGFFKNHESREMAHVKTLHLYPNARISLQRHKDRDETWTLIEGDAQATTGPDLEHLTTVELELHKPFKAGRGMLHRLASREGCIIVEVMAGKYDEQDIERFDDDYGRA